MQNDDEQQLHTAPTASQTQSTSTNARPQQSQQQSSRINPTLSSFTTARSNDVNTRPGNDRNNTSNTANTATSKMRRVGTSGTNKTWGLNNASDRAEKKQEQKVDVANDYFTLNPWYNQQKAKPVFGLAAPLPRTVRKGMWWGRGDLRRSLYKVDEQQDDVGIEQHNSLDFQKDNGKCSLRKTRKGPRANSILRGLR